MAKPKTPGTLLELRAMADLYQRNVLLYKPYDLGMWLVKDTMFKQPFMRIFLAPHQHYDTVYTKAYIIKAGFCQGICAQHLGHGHFCLMTAFPLP